MIKRVCVVACVVMVACHQSNQLPPEAWGVSDYTAAGLHIDSPWTAGDYVAAQHVLERIAVDHRERLPRFRGARSGAVFAKLLGELPVDAAAPVSERFVGHGTRFEALKDIAKLYAPDLLGPPTREWIELMGQALQEAAAVERDADAFIASFGADDPKRANRLEGLEQMTSGFSTMIVGGLMVADQVRLADDDRIAMLTYVTAALPTLYPRAKPDVQHQIRDLIDKEAAGFPQGPLALAAVAAQHALPPP